MSNNFDCTIDNPFADLAVQQLTANTSTNLKEESYNPFDKTPPENSQKKPPPYTKTAQQTRLIPKFDFEDPKPVLSIQELMKRQEELEQKAKELARREQELQKTSATIIERRNNWPPVSNHCCFQPCFYQDIQIDIPVEFQKIVKNLYYLWIFHGIIMLLNVIGGIILRDLKIVGLGITYFLLFTPFSYLCWFRPAYKAFRSDSSFNFMLFFFIFFFQFIITTIQAIGINSGTIGIITAINAFGNSTGKIISGVVAMIIASGFAFAAAADLLLMTKIHKMYRSTGASLAKAQEEFAVGFLQNQHVKKAANSVAASAARAKFYRGSNN